MIRGTTPLHTFTLPFDTDLICTVRVLYSQNNKVVLRKCIEECKLSENCIKVKLSQEDTLAFDCKYPVEIQVRVLLQDGEALASVPHKVALVRCLENEVLE